MNTLSIIIRGMRQLMILKNSREVDPVFMAGLCATENHLCLIIYSKIHSILSPNEKDPILFRGTLYPTKGIHFPASVESECVHMTKF